MTNYQIRVLANAGIVVGGALCFTLGGFTPRNLSSDIPSGGHMVGFLLMALGACEMIRNSTKKD